MQKEVHKKNLKCGAKTRASGGHPCKLPAGWGTNHPGTGRCRFHGGSSTGPKKHNNYKNAEKHGLFTKYLPKETMELVNSIEDLDTLEILWDNIKIQYAAIIRAQKIMYVKTKDDLVKELKNFKETPNGMTVEEYEIQFAWDRYEKFLNSQARAMTNLTSMIGKFEELASGEQLLKVEKVKAEIEKMKGIGEEIEDLSEIESLIYGKEENDKL